MEVSSQPDIFSNEAGGIIVLNEAQIQSFIEGGSGSPLAQMKTIITMDPPEHRSYRKVASGYFTPRGVTNLDEIVKRSCQQRAVRVEEPTRQDNHSRCNALASLP